MRILKGDQLCQTYCECQYKHFNYSSIINIHSRFVNDLCFGFRAYSLFYDESRSVQFLAEYQKEFLFNEEPNVGMEDDSEDEEDIKKEETANMETTDN